MRAYIAITGVVFALIVLAHTARLFAEGFHVVRQPVFSITTALSAGLCLWACRLLLQRS